LPLVLDVTLNKIAPYPFLHQKETIGVSARGTVTRSDFGMTYAVDGGIVGEAAVDFISQFKVDFAVIGASAIDADGALLDFDFREVKVAQAIISNARHVILAADSTKFDRSAPVRIGHLSQIGTFVCDRCPPALKAVCRDNDVRLVEANTSAAA
ncbi:MAG: hypothetical protein AAFW98_06200, partial [Pseudomonadota bacterium]